MKETIVSVLAVFICAASVRPDEIGKDGFNFYKDYLRGGRSDEVIPEAAGDVDRMLYFYRTPVQLYPGLVPVLEQEYRKRTGNAFKNHMLNKELWEGEKPRKRSSKTALSLMLQGKTPYQANEGNYCPYGK